MSELPPNDTPASAAERAKIIPFPEDLPERGFWPGTEEEREAAVHEIEKRLYSLQEDVPVPPAESGAFPARDKKPQAADIVTFPGSPPALD
jgi:hypothetical protein